VIAYRELRLLELDVLRASRDPRQQLLAVHSLIRLDVDQFYGIEIEEFPAQIAQVALWLMDHQMNQLVSEEFGLYFARIPLQSSANIVCANALRIDWNEVIPSERLSYILGNPPFLGKNYQNADQRADMAALFAGVSSGMLLDYVACWYRKAAAFMAMNPALRCAFVSTNSICQGEQVIVLWPELLRGSVKIHFAHRTFQWSNEARSKVAVHCVIIGFGLEDVAGKWLFEYETLRGEPQRTQVCNVNPYLVDGQDLVIEKRRKPLCPVLEMRKGSQPTDGGNLLLTNAEKAALLHAEPEVAPWIRSFVGSEEFINGTGRWCLWLKKCGPEILRKMPEVLRRVEAVRAMRLTSTKASTRTWAGAPTVFTEDRQPESDYLLVPSVSSELRPYMPIGFMAAEVVVSNLAFAVPNANRYHLGVLSSIMHMAWMRTVCGRLKSDYRYSAIIVYNNFPWPENPNAKHTHAIEAAAQEVLEARAQYPEASLADLYDPLTMPAPLLKAHHRLDRAVDAAYTTQAFSSEAHRVAFLFERYARLVAS
jgi:hypothetical protein